MFTFAAQRLDMDSLTQIAIGIATADLCAGKKLGRKSYLYGAILGTLPDLDVAVGMMFYNPVDATAIHRGFSHSIVFFLLLSPILGWLIRKLEKGRITFRQATLLSFSCLVTHVLIDMFTSWGTQVFWPLTERIAFKTIFVVDPLYTILLLICLVLGVRKRDFILRKKLVLRSLYISSAYLFITCCIKLYALNRFTIALEQQNIAYNEIIVKPTAFNCILWNANVATKDDYLLADYSLFDTQPIRFTHYSKNNELAKQLEGNKDFETLKLVSEGWYIVTHNNNRYVFNDLRFGLASTDSANPKFVFSYEFKDDNGKLTAHEVVKQREDGRLLLKKIAGRITGN